MELKLRAISGDKRSVLAPKKFRDGVSVRVFPLLTRAVPLPEAQAVTNTV